MLSVKVRSQYHPPTTSTLQKEVHRVSVNFIMVASFLINLVGRYQDIPNSHCSTKLLPIFKSDISQTGSIITVCTVRCKVDSFATHRVPLFITQHVFPYLPHPSSRWLISPDIFLFLSFYLCDTCVCVCVSVYHTQARCTSYESFLLRT